MALRRTSISVLQGYVNIYPSSNFEGDTPAREDWQNVHDQAVKNMSMSCAEVVEAVEHDELDIVVGLLHDEVYEAGGGS